MKKNGKKIITLQLCPSLFAYLFFFFFHPKKRPFKFFFRIYSLRPTLFVLFEKSNFLREHHLLSCLPFKNV